MRAQFLLLFLHLKYVDKRNVKGKNIFPVNCRNLIEKKTAYFKKYGFTPRTFINPLRGPIRIGGGGLELLKIKNIIEIHIFVGEMGEIHKWTQGLEIQPILR